MSAYLANRLLDHATGRLAFAKPSAAFAKLHTGDPGAAGTSNQSAQTTRISTSFNAAAAGSITQSNQPEFTLNAAEIITHVSYWDAATGGNFLWSATASVQKGGDSGDIIRVQSSALSLSPIAS